MKKVAAGVLSGFLFLAMAAPYALAQMGNPGGGPGNGCQGDGMPRGRQMRHDGMRGERHHLWMTLSRLGLDEKQKEAVKAIQSRTAKDTVRKKADIQLARIDLREILAKDQVDLSAAEANLKRTAALQTDIRLSHIKAMQEIKALLTPEQRAKFKELREWGPRGVNMSQERAGMTMAGNGAEQFQETE